MELPPEKVNSLATQFNIHPDEVVTFRNALKAKLLIFNPANTDNENVVILEVFPKQQTGEDYGTYSAKIKLISTIKVYMEAF